MTVTADRRVRTIYISLVIGIGLVTVAWSLWQLSASPPDAEWFILAALTLFSGSFTVKLPSLPAKISVSDTFVFTSALLFGPAAGTITVVLDALVISLWMKPAERPVVRVLFNVTAPAIAIRAASEAFFALAAISPGAIGRAHVGELVAPVFAFAFLYFLVNTALVAGALATESSDSALSIWVTNFPSVSISYFVGSSIALLIVAYTDRIDATVLSIILPVLVISYFTFKTSMGRLNDAIRHVAQVNELYLSTVETLAMAADAKDQITHGHIRRVQVYATELAKRLGLTSPEQLKAVEVAALLHDMGKLAIPERILNKPGKLTTAEFDKMKRHADIGADLLSSIRFPYPVIPIVRHHHENWDGTGYPAGLAGSDIPIGARILSVVDCFDALTSDRPYRPRLTVDDAFQILRQRRGSMYDPVIVDEFIRAHAEIAGPAVAAGNSARSLIPLGTADNEEMTPLKDIRANAAQTALLHEFATAVKSTRTLTNLVQVVEQHFRMLTPTTAAALFVYSPHTDTLTCVDPTSAVEHVLAGLTIRMGERITGWAAANEKTIANSDASLDLGAIADSFKPPLRIAIAAPIIARGRVIGVLTGYTTKDQHYSDDDRYAAEQLASILAEQARELLSSTAVRVVPLHKR